MTNLLEQTIRYRPFTFDPPANPMGNKLDTPFGNPAYDNLFIQIDATYANFVENYDAIRHGGYVHDYIAEDQLPLDTRIAVLQFLCETCRAEYPEHFTLPANSGGLRLENRLLGESIDFDRDYKYTGGGRHEYRDGLDAVAAQIPEDLAIVQVENGQDRLAAVHVTAPSGWAPREKLGGSFLEVHHPVEHHREWFAKVQAGVRNLAKSERPIQRFGWGLTNDARLDHHPNHGGFSGECRVRGDRDLYVRTERQVLKGFPTQSALLFTIRVYVERCADLPPTCRAKLRDAVAVMSSAERAYKGVLSDFDQIIERLSD